MSIIYYETDKKICDKYLEDSVVITNCYSKRECETNEMYIRKLSQVVSFLTSWAHNSGNGDLINNLPKKLKAFEDVLGAKPVRGMIVGSESSRAKIWLLYINNRMYFLINSSQGLSFQTMREYTFKERFKDMVDLIEHMNLVNTCPNPKIVTHYGLDFLKK